MRACEPILGIAIPDSKVHGARQDPGGPHVGHRIIAVWDHVQMGYMPYYVNVIFWCGLIV